jgi:hypothetical protein
MRLHGVSAKGAGSDTSKQTTGGPAALSETCQFRKSVGLLDHLAGVGKQYGRHRNAQRFGSLEVDYEIELLGPLYR